MIIKQEKNTYRGKLEFTEEEQTILKNAGYILQALEMRIYDIEAELDNNVYVYDKDMEERVFDIQGYYEPLSYDHKDRIYFDHSIIDQIKHLLFGLANNENDILEEE